MGSFDHLLGTGGSFSTAFAVAAGELIIVGEGAATLPTDAAGDTFSQAAGQAGSEPTYIFAAQSAGMASGSAMTNATVAGSFLGVSNLSYGAGYGAGAANTTAASTSASVAVGDLVVSFAYWNGGAIGVLTSGWSAVGTIGTSNESLWYHFATVAGVQTVTWNSSGATQNQVAIVAFRTARPNRLTMLV